MGGVGRVYFRRLSVRMTSNVWLKSLPPLGRVRQGWMVIGGDVLMYRFVALCIIHASVRRSQNMHKVYLVHAIVWI